MASNQVQRPLKFQIGQPMGCSSATSGATTGRSVRKPAAATSRES